jgi:hypothetical protein
MSRTIEVSLTAEQVEELLISLAFRAKQTKVRKSGADKAILALGDVIADKALSELHIDKSNWETLKQHGVRVFVLKCEDLNKDFAASLAENLVQSSPGMIINSGSETELAECIRNLI